jgi:hypothetical protein
MKYKLTNETKKHGEATLYRIQALKDFGAVKAGDLGGWVANRCNLSQEGDCWVRGIAHVRGNALPCTLEKSQVSEFNFSNLPSEVEEVVIAGVCYKKETTWKKN